MKLLRRFCVWVLERTGPILLVGRANCRRCGTKSEFAYDLVPLLYDTVCHPSDPRLAEFRKEPHVHDRN